MYRTINAAFWTDETVRTLNPDERYFFLYLITNPHTHVSGIYYLPWLIAQQETGLPERAMQRAADTLSRTGNTLFDRPNNAVFVVNMFMYQGRGQKNTLSAAYHLAEDMHKSFLVNEFLKRYPDVQIAYKNRVSEFGIPEQTPEQNRRGTEQEQKEERRAVALPALFLTFGEFQNVRMTASEFEAVKNRLNGSTEEYIQRLDRYARINPKKFKAYKDHHLVLMSWFEKDVKTASNQRRFKETVAPLKSEFSMNGATHDTNHRCELCQEPHAWTCTDVLCTLEKTVPCPSWMAAYRQRTKRV